MLRKLTIGSTMYSCIIFKEINSNGFFHVSEDCLYDLFYWSTVSETFVGYWGRMKVKGNGQSCIAVWYLTLLLGYFILPPHWLVSVMPCPRKSQKETKMFLLYFPLFTGFNNHSMDEVVFPEYNWNGWIPQLRSQKYVDCFLHMFVLIWYLGVP